MENYGCDLDANSLDFVEKEFSKVEKPIYYFSPRNYKNQIVGSDTITFIQEIIRTPHKTKETSKHVSAVIAKSYKHNST
jgi:hypothetical protein